ncbi:THAP domain-containing protein 9 [Cyphomyrmex costatus]|uniref:THAP domain-containing protein 9 n=1 Tax=Cyphomyrmex costatus TaxID=456900 RepID=A0A151K1Q0_9HYME|nr:THAP domain-containing protein 9 [Cyphomyrmex costatus]KYN50056.1 THAP domain-containing protein 9 [Cyphomyrmex costatus]
MARSIAGNWKVPLCYCFAGTTCTSDTIKNIIFDAIIKLRESGATVHALVTDMGSNFLQISRELEFYDKFASWSYIVQFYSKDTQQWIKAAFKLSPIHIEPNNFSKMKVRYAVQVLSNHVAVGMCTLMSVDCLPSEAIGTIKFIDRFDKLFDILNSSFTISLKEYRTVFTGSTKQVEFLQETLIFLKDITAVNNKGKTVKIKCFECWQVTINSIIQLWEILKTFNFPYLQTYRINQD